MVGSCKQGSDHSRCAEHSGHSTPLHWSIVFKSHKQASRRCRTFHITKQSSTIDTYLRILPLLTIRLWTLRHLDSTIFITHFVQFCIHCHKTQFPSNCFIICTFFTLPCFIIIIVMQIMIIIVFWLDYMLKSVWHRLSRSSRVNCLCLHRWFTLSKSMLPIHQKRNVFCRLTGTKVWCL